MAAFNVVSVDLQLRLGGDVGIWGDDEISVALIGIRLLSIRMHVNLAAEHARRLAPQHAFVEFVAAAMGSRVFDRGVVVDML